MSDDQKRKSSDASFEPLGEQRAAVEDHLDRALREWPAPQKSAGEWDEQVASIERKIGLGVPAQSHRDVSDTNLFTAPLAQGGEHVQNSAQYGTGRDAPTFRERDRGSRIPAPDEAPEDRMGTQSERQRDRKSLQDLARLASSPTMSPLSSRTNVSSSNDPDSGVVDLKSLAAADPGAEERAKTTPLAAAPLVESAPPEALNEPVSGSGPISRGAMATPLALNTPAPSLAPAAMAVTAAATPAAVRARKASASKAPMIMAGVAVVLAMAAGAVFMVRSNGASAPAAASQSLGVQNPVAAKEATKPAAADQVLSQPAAVAANADETDNATESTKGATNAPRGVRPAVANLAKGGAAPAPVAAAPKAAEAPAPAPVEAKPAPEPKPVAQNGEKSLEDQIRGAVGVSGKAAADEPTAAAAPAAGAVPTKPSPGAVQGALGNVLGAARSCLGPDDPVSRASVTFQSSGTVQSVAVSGGAAGKPAEGCIRAALMKAKVAPFAQATYPASVTVRPN